MRERRAEDKVIGRKLDKVIIVSILSIFYKKKPLNRSLSFNAEIKRKSGINKQKTDSKNRQKILREDEL